MRGQRSPAFASLSGTASIDFNPPVDKLRVVTSSGQNLRVDPATGALVMADTALEYASDDRNDGEDPAVVAAAYTANVASEGTTTRYEFGSRGSAARRSPSRARFARAAR